MIVVGVTKIIVWWRDNVEIYEFVEEAGLHKHQKTTILQKLHKVSKGAKM